MTSSSYKRKLKKHQCTKTRKTKKETKPKGQKAKVNLKTKKKHCDKKKQKSSEKEKPVENQESTCAVCKGSWRESQMDWIVCRVCTVWVQEDCTVNEVCFLCD